MIYYLDYKHKEWPAQERLCRDLGVSHSRIKGNGADFHLLKIVLSFLTRKPLSWYRLFSALGEYWDCKILIRYLEKEAAMVRTAKNKDLVESILRAAGKNLVVESREDWPELIGLFGQKLAHLRYYDEFYKDKV